MFAFVDLEGIMNREGTTPPKRPLKEMTALGSTRPDGRRGGSNIVLSVEIIWI